MGLSFLCKSAQNKRFNYITTDKDQSWTNNPSQGISCMTFRDVTVSSVKFSPKIYARLTTLDERAHKLLQREHTNCYLLNHTKHRNHRNGPEIHCYCDILKNVVHLRAGHWGAVRTCLEQPLTSQGWFAWLGPPGDALLAEFETAAVQASCREQWQKGFLLQNQSSFT